jgi:hypothetical protein
MSTPTPDSPPPPSPKLKRYKTAASDVDSGPRPAPRAYVLPKAYVRRPLYLDHDEAALIEEIGVCVEYKELSIHSLRQVIKYVMDAPMVPFEPSDERDMHVAQMIATAAQAAADFEKSEHEGACGNA